MKTRMIIAIAAFMVFGLSIAAVAYTRTSGATSAASCCKGDSCPMKTKTAAAGEKSSCCDACDCCGAQSCPMKGEKMKAMHSATARAKAESCPMKAAATATAVSFDKTNVVVATGESCCGCSCCGSDKEKKDAPAV